MEKSVLFSDKNLIIEYSKSGDYLNEAWFGYTSKEVFIKLLEKFINFLEEIKPKGILLDAREHSGLSIEMQEYAANKIADYTLKNGSLKEAIILPKSVFSEFSVKNYHEKTMECKGNTTTMFFDDLQKAKEWLVE